MANQSAKGFQRLYNATLYSIKGFKATWKHEEAFRQEVLLFIIAVPLALLLGNNGIEHALLITSIILILIVELLNSAIESIVDRISLERHELSGRAKDIAAAAVMLSVWNAIVVWALILI